MDRFLKRYLTVTGIAAALAILFPALVIVAGMALIIPGFLLALAPTAFLWGCIFAAARSAIKNQFGDRAVSVVAAAALTLVTVVSATQPSRSAGMAALRRSSLPDITPPNRLALQGDVRVDKRAPSWDNVNSRGQRGLRGFACDELCLALLFTPGVTSVTINNSARFSVEEHRNGTGGFDPEARTYRMLPRSKCPNGGIRFDPEARRGYFPTSEEDMKATDAAWKRRLAEEVCVVRGDLLTKHDLLIRHGHYGSPVTRKRMWSLWADEPRVEYVEIRNESGSILRRSLRSSVRILTRILWIEPVGGMDDFRFGWATTERENKREFYPDTSQRTIELRRELEDHTNAVGR